MVSESLKGVKEWVKAAVIEVCMRCQRKKKKNNLSKKNKKTSRVSMKVF